MIVSLKNIYAIALCVDAVSLARHFCECDSPHTLLFPTASLSFPAHLLMLVPIQADQSDSLIF